VAWAARAGAALSGNGGAVRRLPVLPVYGVVAAADVVLAGRRSRRARWCTKPLLMPLLIAAAMPGGEREPTVLAGLALSGVGDVALLGEGEAAFGAGLAAFLAAHCCYIAAFRRRRRAGVRGRSPAAGLYLLAWLTLSAVLLPRTGRFRVPVLGYGAALACMAVAALDTGDPRLAAGGAAFLVSDSLLALDAFDVVRPPGADAMVMLTYTVAQALIATGTARTRPGPATLGPTGAPRPH